MRAIIIKEDRFTEVRALMKAACEELKRNNEHSEYVNGVQAAERAINYVFVRWAQSHGAGCVK